MIKNKKYFYLILTMMHISKIDIKNYTKVSNEEIIQLEKEIKRTLPEEYKYFLKEIGYGEFIYGGKIDSIADIKKDISMPIFFYKGSMSKNNKWASLEEHNSYYITRGWYNPNPSKFKNEEMYFKGYNLFDLVNIGGNGGCDYLCLNTNSDSKIKFCLLTSYETIEYESESFFKGFYYLLVDMYCLDNNILRFLQKRITPILFTIYNFKKLGKY